MLDCVYCRDIDSDEVEEIMESVLSRQLRKHRLNRKANRAENSRINGGGIVVGEGVVTHLRNETKGIMAI